MPKKQKIGYQPLETAYTRDIDVWFIVLMLALFFPIGLYLMWTRTSWKNWIKILVTALIAALFLSRIVSAMLAPPAETPSDPSAVTTEASAELPGIHGGALL